MPKRLLHQTARIVERGFDLRRRSFEGNMVVSTYRGFGRANELLVRGRVLMERTITRAREAESTWRNLINTYRRFQSDEVENAKVRASYRDSVGETVTNAEGYFDIRLQPKLLAEHTLWHEVAIELPDKGVTAIANVVIPSEAAKFGIISDIDDTIVQTNATNMLRMIRSVINNAAARLPFKGVSELYRALHADRNPLFYVSSSPWNLYELLDDYMNIHGIPPGPMFLQDWGIDEKTLILASHTQHKLAQIQTLVDFYPQMKFVLIGDSGQHDPEIYLEVIRAHPGRVLAVIIRDVTDERARDEAVARIANDAKTLGVEMVYVQDSDDALKHAKRLELL